MTGLLRYPLALAIVICAPFVTFCGPSETSPQPILTVTQYVAELDRCSSAVRESRADPSALSDLRKSLPDNWNVSAEGQTYRVSTAWLIESLSRAESDPAKRAGILAATREKLSAYRQAAQSFAKAPSRSAESPRTKLNAILTSKDFATMRGPTWLELLRQRFYDWIYRQLSKLFGRIHGGRSLGNLVAWIVLVLATILLALWAVRYSIRGVRSEMDLRGTSAPGKDWRDWLRAAQEAASRGDYRVAIHAAYWAAIARLEETNSLPEDRSRTPRESLRLVRRESAEYAPLSQLTRRFELVWYGYRAATAADWDDAKNQLGTLGCLRSSTPAISAS